MQVKKVTQSAIDRHESKEAGIKSSVSDEYTQLFDIDGLNSSLMGMLPGQVDGLRR